MSVTVSMPQLGETVTEGTILRWAKQVGDAVAVDEVLLEISTDKVDTEIPSPAAGTLLEILVPEGDTVNVGTPLAVIGEAAEAPTEPEPEPEPEPALAAEEAPVAAAPAAPVAQAVGEAPAAAPADLGPLSPVVRKLAAEHGVDLAQVPGTGREGRITRRDVEAFIQAAPSADLVEVSAEIVAAPTEQAPTPIPSPAPAATTPLRPPPAPEAPAPAPQAPPVPVTAVPAAPAPAAPVPAAPVPAAPVPAAPEAPVAPETGPGGYLLRPGDSIADLDRMRLRIAENMVASRRTAAHVWTSVEVDFEAVEQVRQRHKEAFKAREGFSLTYMPFIARATIDALGAFPVVNSSFHLEEQQRVDHAGVHMGIAVDMDQGGLVVMTILSADGMRMRELARRIRDVAEKARGGKLSPDDLVGSTFTITNPGPYGSFMSAPIINIPNVAILSTDTVAKRPVVVADDSGKDAIGIRHIGYLGLTWDHRAFDGSTAVLFLRRIKEAIETWDWEHELG
jgi:2-oxoglutarate dehydrogenase E2 component (dihydrolipoamide succinyltransferase)